MVLSAFLLPVMAEHSTITDKAAGLAADIVETDSVIHVYRYLGESSEALGRSTFDEGETWFQATSSNYTVTPVVPVTPPTRRSITETSSYVQAIDKCVDEGNTWDYKTDTCRDNP